MAQKSHTLPNWVQLYFVFASLLGLFMIVMGSSMGLNTLLTQYFFPVESVRPLPPEPYFLQKNQFDIAGAQQSEDLTDDQKALLAQWESDYKYWQEYESKRDYEQESRMRTFATALAMILVGVPVFAVHVPFVFRQKN